MRAKAGGKILTLAIIALCAMTPTAWAQITTGSVAGTVKDTQGWVIPGATVVATSEARGTKSSPVVTTSTGDFVIPNIQAGTYTIEVSMPSFKTLKREGIAVSPGARATLGDLVLQVGGTSEVIDVKGEAPVIQATSGE